MDGTIERQAMANYALKCGQNIARRRAVKGLTQAQLAERLGVQQAAVSKWEKGQRLPRDYWRARLSYELGEDLDKLFPATIREALSS